MTGTHDLWLFVLSGLLLNVTPGADSLYIATRSVTQGVRAGIAAALGIGAGCCVHMLAAALGLSAILATSAVAFTVVKVAGAAYLVFIGLTLLRRRPADEPALRTLAPATWSKVFWQGFLTNVLNPKVALFFLAFMPQFIDPGATHKALAFLFLGAIFNVNGTLWCLMLAWITARAGAVRMGRTAAAWLGRSVGALFILLGVRLAFARHP